MLATTQLKKNKSDSIDALFQQLDPPLLSFSADDNYEKELMVTRYIWKTGSYYCGITAHIIFFLLSPGFVERAAKVKPQRFGQLIKFALSFDFTDIFIKQVTASGRGRASGMGLHDASVQRMLRGIQKAHDKLDIPHVEMVHFGYRLLQQLESDIGDLSETAKQHHLCYMSKVYRTMGIPFSNNRALLEDFCRLIEKGHARYTAIAGEYTQRLLFLGLTVGVSCNKEKLSALLPEYIKPVFDANYAQMRPSLAWQALGNVLNVLLYPRRRFRNPLPTAEEKALITSLED